ncbi:MAG: hypothetical protein AAF657_16885, partial [Acidobacteriota bacterium]
MPIAPRSALRGAIRRLGVATLLCAAAIAQAAPQPGAVATRPLAVDDLFALAGVSDPQISPDGAWVAYVVSRTDLDKDESEAALWLAAVGDSSDEPRRLTAPGYSASRPRWSPDGRHLAFLAARKTSDEEAKTQVWAFDLRGGDAQPLTSVQQGVGSFDYSPDGTRLLLTIRDPRPEDLMDKAERSQQKPQPHVIDRRQFKRDYEGYLDRRRNHLYVFELASKKLRQITSGDYDAADGAWSPDGKLVAFSSNRTAEPDGNSNSDLWIVSASNTDQGKTLR